MDKTWKKLLEKKTTVNLLKENDQHFTFNEFHIGTTTIDTYKFGLLIKLPTMHIDKSI
jgi:hypothetical protein